MLTQSYMYKDMNVKLGNLWRGDRTTTFPGLKIPLENLTHQHFIIKTSKIKHWCKMFPNTLHDSYRNLINTWFYR